MSTTAPRARGLSTGVWTLDPARSSVAFHVRHFYGLVTVKGHFDSYSGTLDLSATPAVELVIDADSLDTNNKQRDNHLRSADFFDVANHPQVRFAADDVTLNGDKMSAHGRLYAAGKDIALDARAAIKPAANGFEIVATALADHRELGMTWSPLGILRAPSKLIVRGHLIPIEAAG
jgi:polyisoprenoid-binding protein YceI